MTPEDIIILQSPEVREAIRANLGKDPVKVALDKRLPHPSLVATQVKYLERARRKLPSYYEARCIIPSLAFEQSSSEQAAAHKSYSGGLCIDLTCGLGVDSLHFSRSFGEVISVERDAVLAEIARINFGRLEANNITVVNSSAEKFLEEFMHSGRKADLIYLDPDRRSQAGKKLVRLEDCSPNVVALLPRLKAAADRIVVKASPIFDVDEAFRIFGDDCMVDVVSLDGECKEVLIETGSEADGATIKASVIGTGAVEFPYGADDAPGCAEFAPPYKYMVIPDVALRKARLTARYFAAIASGVFVVPADGYVFLYKLPADVSRPILGRIFDVIEMSQYNRAAAKRSLAGAGIKSAEIYLHNFRRTTAELCRELGIKEGGNTKLAFTTINGEPWMIRFA